MPVIITVTPMIMGAASAPGPNRLIARIAGGKSARTTKTDSRLIESERRKSKSAVAAILPHKLISRLDGSAGAW
jgi:hypothetical protein